jgi:hypothetical protein
MRMLLPMKTILRAFVAHLDISKRQGLPRSTRLLWAIRYALATLACLAVIGCDNTERDAEERKEAIANAHSYMTDLGIKDTAVSCVGSDTDRDGYLSCTLRHTETHEQGDIQCSTTRGYGCKGTAAKVQPRDTNVTVVAPTVR